MLLKVKRFCESKAVFVAVASNCKGKSKVAENTLKFCFLSYIYILYSRICI